MFIGPDASWFVLLGIGTGALVGVLLYAVSLSKPEEFSNLALVQFFAISAIVVCFILAISWIPTGPSWERFPISTKELTIGNQTQWVLNIGGVKDSDTGNLTSGGLQIPIFIIISGILGSYIRYLYIGIKEFKERNFAKIHELLDAEQKVGLAKSDLEKIRFDKQVLPPDLLENYNRQLEEMEGIYKQLEYEAIQKRIKLRMDEIHHTLESLGFIFLAPLLSVSAWLILVIGGTNNNYTFALVGFSVGLATERIIDSMKSFVGGKLSSDDKPATAKSEKTDPPENTKPAPEGIKSFSFGSEWAQIFGGNEPEKVRIDLVEPADRSAALVSIRHTVNGRDIEIPDLPLLGGSIVVEGTKVELKSQGAPGGKKFTVTFDFLTAGRRYLLDWAIPQHKAKESARIYSGASPQKIVVYAPNEKDAQINIITASDPEGGTQLSGSLARKTDWANIRGVRKPDDIAKITGKFELLP